MRRLLFHAPAVGGHHATYLRYLIAGCAPEPELRVGIVAPAALREFPQLMQDAKARGIELFLQPTTRRRLTPSVLAPWFEARDAAAQFRPSRVTFLYGDALLNSAFAAQWKLGTATSAILFRPTVHYAANRFAPLTRSERLRSVRQRVALRLSELNPELRQFFWLDPYGARYMQEQAPLLMRSKHPSKHAWLPDPLDTSAVASVALEAVSKRVGHWEGRKCYLLFGPPSERKGVEPVLEAVLRLPPEVARTMHLLLVGQASESRRALLSPLVSAARTRLSGALTWIDERVEEDAVPAYFQLADVVLVPYQRHVGSSGVLLRAAQAGKPLIGSDFGLVGAWTRDNGLGLALDTESVATLAQAFVACSCQGVVGFSAERAQRFAAQFEQQHFADALLGQRERA